MDGTLREGHVYRKFPERVCSDRDHIREKINTGETKQVTTVTDKVTGEVLKIDVTLSLDK
jgi:hypothetical protein